MFRKYQHLERFGTKEVEGRMLEAEIVDKFLTDDMIHKVKANITNGCGGWVSQYIPRLMETVYYDLIREETWNFLKLHKYPVVDFRKLRKCSEAKVREVLGL